MDLKEYRKSLFLTQEQAGAELGLTKQRWGQIEKSWPFLATNSLLQIVRAFDARIILEPGKGCRFLSAKEIESWEGREINSLDYLPDVDPEDH